MGRVSWQLSNGWEVLQTRIRIQDALEIEVIIIDAPLGGCWYFVALLLVALVEVGEAT